MDPIPPFRKAAFFLSIAVMFAVAHALLGPGRFWAAFVINSALGLLTEVIFTGIADQFRHRRKPIPGFDPVEGRCRTYVWSVLTYGFSATVAYPFIDRFYPEFFAWNWIWRGCLYFPCIFFTEYAWGKYIEWAFARCPWQYRHDTWKFWKYINPYFTPLWFAFGFMLELTYRALVPLAPTIVDAMVETARTMFTLR